MWVGGGGGASPFLRRKSQAEYCFVKISAQVFMCCDASNVLYSEAADLVPFDVILDSMHVSSDRTFSPPPPPPLCLFWFWSPNQNSH